MKVSRLRGDGALLWRTQMDVDRILHRSTRIEADQQHRGLVLAGRLD